MRYLNLYGLADGENISVLPPALTVPGEEKSVVVFDGGRMSSCALEKREGQIIFRRLNSVSFPEKHAGILFGNSRMIEREASWYERLAGLTAQEDSGWALHVKEKKGAYVRLILVRQKENIFREKYCAWDDWTVLRDELRTLGAEIDFLIKNSGTETALEKMSLQKDVLNRLLGDTGFPEPPDTEKPSRLDVFYGRDTELLPFESFSDRFFVRTFVPGQKRRERKPGEGLTLIYSEALENARREAEEIVGAVKERYPVELYSDRLHDRFRSGPRSSRFLHFAGHGSISEGKGRIHLGQSPLDSLVYSHDAELAFLNCCHAGSAADGIVLSLLNGGTERVIASPYEIADFYSEMPQAGGFYSALDPEDIELSWRIFCLKNPYFGLFFRFFSSYR